MIIGLPREVKKGEHRVALYPAAIRELTRAGHRLLVETGAGAGSGFTDREYRDAGAEILAEAGDIWANAAMILKVKEPQESEFVHLREGLILFTYLHLAAERAVAEALLANGVSAIAYETVEDRDGRLPLLEPMSEVAGRMATQIVAHFSEKEPGGRGILLGGVPGVSPAHLVILGGGTVGTHAARIALGMGARITILDINLERLRYLDQTLPGRFSTLYSSQANITEAIRTADAVIGSVLIRGARAPHLISRPLLAEMPPGSLIVDVAVDQGGCVETTRPTSHDQPIFYLDGIAHYGVTNIPGAVPRTSSLALANATLRSILRIANAGMLPAFRADPGLAFGLNAYQGAITYSAVADELDLPARPLEKVLSDGCL